MPNECVLAKSNMPSSKNMFKSTWTKPITDHTLSITCGASKHHSMLEVANLILAVGHDVIQKFHCVKCKVKTATRIKSFTG